MDKQGIDPEHTSRLRRSAAIAASQPGGHAEWSMRVLTLAAVLLLGAVFLVWNRVEALETKIDKLTGIACSLAEQVDQPIPECEKGG